jgi:uncharacterized membrane protein YvbJ
MLNFCIHKFGKVEDNYQYCSKCGKAIEAPKVKCDHKWETIVEGDVSSNITSRIIKKVYVNRCIICGEIKRVEIEA